MTFDNLSMKFQRSQRPKTASCFPCSDSDPTRSQPLLSSDQWGQRSWGSEQQSVSGAAAPGLHKLLGYEKGTEGESGP